MDIIPKEIELKINIDNEDLVKMLVAVFGLGIVIFGFVLLANYITK